MARNEKHRIAAATRPVRRLNSARPTQYSPATPAMHSSAATARPTW